ncbi:MAG: phosphoribosylglycinamide formyltransferase [Candidatus Hydrogenedentota bacterium]
MPLKVAVLLSGSGSTLQNLIEHIEQCRLDARINCVVASRPDAYGLVRAQNHGIPHAIVSRKEFKSVDDFSAAVWTEIDRHAPGLVVMAGFMCLLRIPDAYANRVINVHPALIPAFCGKGMYGHHVHEAVLAYGAKISGCTVHFADNQYDHGPIILQAHVPVLEDDTVDTLAERVQAKEREVYPRAIQMIAEGRVSVDGRRVRVLEKKEVQSP